MPENESGPRPNARRSRRLPAKGSTRLRAYRNAMGLGPNIGVRVLDVSESGVCLALTEALPPGCEFEVTLEGPGGQTLKASATVVWASKAEDGTFITGVSLGKAASHQVIAALARV